jgi:hypothetical protein
VYQGKELGYLIIIDDTFFLVAVGIPCDSLDVPLVVFETFFKSKLSSFYCHDSFLAPKLTVCLPLRLSVWH